MEVTDKLDLGRLGLLSGEARRFDLAVDLGRFEFGVDRYDTAPAPAPVLLEVNRMVGEGLALRIRLEATLLGRCMRCLGPAAPAFSVDVREIHQPGGGEQLESDYLDEHEVLDLHAWVRDAYLLELPPTLLCRPDCAGLCPECGVDLNADPTHAHERPPDPRWAKLRELDL